MIEAKHTKKVYNSYKKHHHDSLSIATIKQGKIHIEFDDKELFLIPNTLAIFNPYENHKTTIVDENTRDYYILDFDLSLCLEIQACERFNPINQAIITDSAIHQAFFSLFQSQEKEETKRFLIFLFKHYTDKTYNPKITPSHLDTIKEFIETNNDNALDLEQLSRYAGISQNHLIKIFKKEFGLSPHAYILNHKIHKAKKLLKKGVPISQVAVEAGFYDQSHFHKAFKSVFAITPKEFQKK